MARTPDSLVEARLGYRFRNRSLLHEALTHRSFGTPHNERMEFLGDSVVNCVVAGVLFERFPSLREGDLTRLRAALVRQDTLHQIALRMELGASLRLGEGEVRSGGAQRPSILADALEALAGAVWLDGGFEAAQEVLVRCFEPEVASLDIRRALRDPKTCLQEWLQARRHPLPRYVLKEVRGEAHAQSFEVECFVDALQCSATGVGASRRAAEQAAAERALERVDPQ